MKARIGHFRILPQWVRCEASGKIQLQVFCAAPSYQKSNIPCLTGYGSDICNLLVSTQYETVAKLSVIYQLLTQKSFSDHFTLVGQKSFKNPPSVMKTSLQKVADIVRGYDSIRPYIHGYNKEDQKIIREASQGASFQLLDMTKEQFMNEKAVDLS